MSLGGSVEGDDIGGLADGCWPELCAFPSSAMVGSSDGGCAEAGFTKGVLAEVGMDVYGAWEVVLTSGSALSRYSVPSTTMKCAATHFSVNSASASYLADNV